MAVPPVEVPQMAVPWLINSAENGNCTNDSFINERVNVYRDVGSKFFNPIHSKRTWNYTAALSPVACRLSLLVCTHSLTHTLIHSLITHTLTHSHTLTTLNSPWGKLRMIVADGSGGDCVVLFYCDEWVSEWAVLLWWLSERVVPNEFSIMWVRTCDFFMVQVAAVVSCVGSSGVHVAGVHVAMWVDEYGMCQGMKFPPYHRTALWPYATPKCTCTFKSVSISKRNSLTQPLTLSTRLTNSITH